MVKKLDGLSIFYPAYNEEANIVKTVEKTIAVLPSIAEIYEVIIVDDGSSDRTKQRVDEMAKSYPFVRCVPHPCNKGYGAALKTGFQNARYPYVFFSDADNQFDLRQIERLIHYLPDADIVVGYRIKRRDPWYRLMNAKAYNLLVRILFGLKVRDIDCAFKLIKKNVIEQVPLYADSQFVSAEFLIKACQKGFVVKEVGVDHFPRVVGKATGNSMKSVITSFQDLFRLYRELKSHHG